MQSQKTTCVRLPLPTGPKPPSLPKNQIPEPYYALLQLASGLPTQGRNFFPKDAVSPP